MKNSALIVSSWRRLLLGAAVCLFVLGGGLLALARWWPQPVSAVRLVAPEAATRARWNETYGQLPLSFEANRGQTDARVHFLARGAGYGVFLTATEAVLTLGKNDAAARKDVAQIPAASVARQSAGFDTLRLRLMGANPAAQAEGMEALPGRSHYLTGNDPQQWRTGVAHFAKVRYAGVYPGVDVIYYGNGRQLEYDFIIAPSAEPGVIKLAFDGAQRVAIDANGELVLQSRSGELRQRKPVVYQNVNGARRVIAGRYVKLGARQVGFRVAAYERSLPLVIDPVLSYTTQFGGSGTEAAYGIALDAAGNVYVTGTTTSIDFAITPGAAQPAFANGSCGDRFRTLPCTDVFVTKLNATGTELIYSTYFGGSDFDEASDIAVDAAGNAYITGKTSSLDLPTVNPLQRTNGVGTLVKSTDGGATWRASSYGLPKAEVRALVVNPLAPTTLYAGTDRQGVYKSTDGGASWSASNAGLHNLPVSTLLIDPRQPTTLYAMAGGRIYKSADAGASWNIKENGFDVFRPLSLALDPTNPATLYAGAVGRDNTPRGDIFKTMDGGESWQLITHLPDCGGRYAALAFAVDPTNAATIYAGAEVCGVYKSTDGGQSWRLSNSGMPSFDTKITLLVVDPLNPATVYAGAESSNGSPGIYKSTDGGASWRLSNPALGNPNVSALVINPLAPATLYAGFSTCPVSGAFMSTNGAGEWTATGLTRYVAALIINPQEPATLYAGLRFWTEDALAAQYNDGFVAKLNAAGTALVYATYLGGAGGDQGNAIVVDTAGQAHVVGQTPSADFPTANALYRPRAESRCGSVPIADGFIAKLNPAGTSLIYSTRLGGDGYALATALALDTAGNVYVTGSASADFRTTPGAVAPSGGGGFVTKLNAAGTEVLYSTFLGGGSGSDIAVDRDGNAYVVGSVAGNSNFPTTPGALQTTPIPSACRDDGIFILCPDAFVMKLNATGSARSYSTLLSTAGGDEINAVAVDANGNAYIVGRIGRGASGGPYGLLNLFAARLNATGSAFDYFVPTNNVGLFYDVAVDNAGNLYGAGVSGLPSFTEPGNNSEVIVARIGGSGNLVGANLSSASYARPPLAHASLATIFGVKLAATTLAASTTPLPTALGGTTVKIKDSAGVERLAPLLYISPDQINYQVPPETALGAATVTVTNSAGDVANATLPITDVAPGLFFVTTINRQNVAASLVLRVKADGTQSYEPVVLFDAATNRYSFVPIDLGEVSDQVYLILFGTGWRGRSSEAAVRMRVGGVDAPVTYAGAQGDLIGLDQLNARLSRSLVGRGEVGVVVTVDGKTANTVRVSIK